MKAVLISFLLVVFACAVSAQDTPPLQPEIVTLETADGVTLIGDYYAQAAPAPTLLLMHMAGGTRAAWAEVAPQFYGQGYTLLAVDLRGHGDSSGYPDMIAAIDDVRAWFAWLMAQPAVQPDRLAAIGGSVGANLAIVGCGDEPACRTAIALSPGSNYYGVEPLPSIEQLRGRTLMILATRRDQSSGDFSFELAEASPAETALIQYPGIGHHGTEILNRRADALPLIMIWLSQHLG